MKHMKFNFLLYSVVFVMLLLTVSCGRQVRVKEVSVQTNKILDEEEIALLENGLVDVADWIMTLNPGSGNLKNTKDTAQSIYINSNLARVLVSAYRITGREQYLTEAVNWADDFCNQQDLIMTSRLNQGGFWPDFPRREKVLYGNIYFGDMGTAATGLSVIYEHVDEKRQRIYLDAMKRMALFVMEGSIKDPQNLGREAAESFIIQSGPDKGALGCGYYRGHLSTAPYTISTATTGGAFMSQLYKLTGDARYLEISKNASAWLLKIQKPDGEIPYTLDGKLYEEWPLDTMTYCTEAFAAVSRFFTEKEKEEFAEKIRPSVEWLLAGQNPDGTWGQLRSQDQQRSPGVLTLLNWYYHNAGQDERVKNAIRKYFDYLQDEENSREYGIKDLVRTTGFAGLAAAEVLQPGVTF